MKGQIAKDFRWEEFERSETAEQLGIDNTIPDDESIKMPLRSLVMNILQPLRNSLGTPVIINSGYRCPALNKALKGAKNSQHCKGEAADIRAKDPLLMAQHIQRNGLPFDQMILYADFIHISHRLYGEQRGQIIYHKSYKEKYPCK